MLPSEIPRESMLPSESGHSMLPSESGHSMLPSESGHRSGHPPAIRKHPCDGGHPQRPSQRTGALA